MRRDRITFAMMLGVPLMQLVLFGFAINNDPKRLPAALVATSNDHYTRAMVSALRDHRLLPLRPMSPRAPPRPSVLMARGDVAFVVTIPADFARRVERGDHPQILIEADATDPAVGERRHLDAGHRRQPGAAARHRACRTRPPRQAAQASSTSSCTGATIPRASRSTTSCPACSASSCR